MSPMVRVEYEPQGVYGRLEAVLPADHPLGDYLAIRRVELVWLRGYRGC